jgi:hypothetical protein
MGGGVRLHLQIALAGQGLQLVDVREERVGEGQDQGGGEVVLAADALPDSSSRHRS